MVGPTAVHLHLLRRARNVLHAELRQIVRSNTVIDPRTNRPRMDTLDPPIRPYVEKLARLRADIDRALREAANPAANINDGAPGSSVARKAARA